MSIEKLCEEVQDVIETARNKVFRLANVSIVRAYWNIGRLIVEEEQNGADRAAYGKQVVKLLSVRLQSVYGKGYNKGNLWYMRQFYGLFEKVHALRGELSWTHFRLLLKVEDKNARDFWTFMCGILKTKCGRKTIIRPSALSCVQRKIRPL